jgi:hypothetical protein
MVEKVALAASYIYSTGLATELFLLVDVVRLKSKVLGWIKVKFVCGEGRRAAYERE